jgi:uroporphyrinogen decarboxylase
MRTELDHWERVRLTLRGEEADRVPISLWRHWPYHDETAEGLAAASLQWQRTYDFDLVKVMPTGTYGIEDWGGRTTYTPNPMGIRTVLKYGVTSAEQWTQLEQFDVTQGYLGQQIAAIRLIAQEIRGSAPVLMTIFSPLTTAFKLAGDSVFAHLRLCPDMLRTGLQIIAEVTVRFAKESIRAGAHGLFFATQCASHRLLSTAEYHEFGELYDRIVLDAVRPEAEILLLHTHGNDVMFDLLADYPADAINWHDRRAGPSLEVAQKRFSGMLVGGINEWLTLLEGSPSDIQAEIANAIVQTAGRRLMIGPGCVLPIHTPAQNVRAAKEAVCSVLH